MHVSMCDGMAWKYTRWTRSGQEDVTQGDDREKGDADTEKRKQTEACAPETGHVYRELDRDMGTYEDTRATRQQGRAESEGVLSTAEWDVHVRTHRIMRQQARNSQRYSSSGPAANGGGGGKIGQFSCV